MKRGVSIFLGSGHTLLTVAIVACVLSAPAFCQVQDLVLLLEQTPAKGGETTPSAGVHHFKPGSEIILTANPKPGYQFVHWLGDVSDSTASSTVVYLNKPKVVVAVFGQSKYDAKGILPSGGGGGGGGLMPTAINFSSQGGLSAGGGGGKSKPGPVTYVLDAPEVPEPATGVLLVVGSMLAFARRRARRQPG
ncbi:MAG: InlB B-repeat-containing protein [Planctomycetota bacterium]|jgi:hypothetical protein